MRLLLSILLCGLLLSACSPSGTAERNAASGSAPAPNPRASLTYAQQRAYDRIFLESVRQREQDNSDAEYELLNEALKIFPDASEAVFRMGLLTLRSTSVTDSLGRARADSLLQRAVALAPANEFYKKTLAADYASQGHFDKAAALFEELARLKPSADNLSYLTQFYEQANDFRGAVSTLERLEQVRGISEEISIAKFQYYNVLGEQEKAFKSIEDLCAAYPNDLRYRVLLGDLYAQSGSDGIALATYNDVLTLEPDNGYAQMSLLAYYKRMGQEELYFNLLQKLVLNPRATNDIKVEAMRSFAVDNLKNHGDSTVVLNLFHEVLAQQQTDRSLCELCAQYLGALGATPDSLESLMLKILDIEPDYTKSRLQLLGLYLEREDEAAILETCRKGRLYDPAQAVFYYYEGVVLYRQGKDSEALSVMREGTAHIDHTTDVEVASDLYALMGDLLHSMKEDDEAFSAYDSALVYNPTNWMCMNNYAYFLALEGKRLNDAHTMSRQTVNHEPDNPTFLDTYAWVLYRMKKYDEARTYIDRTLENSDGDIDATLLDHAGDIYFSLGRRKEAMDYWKQALKKSNEPDEQRALRRKISRRRP